MIGGWGVYIRQPRGCRHLQPPEMTSWSGASDDVMIGGWRVYIRQPRSLAVHQPFRSRRNVWTKVSQQRGKVFPLDLSTNRKSFPLCWSRRYWSKPMKSADLVLPAQAILDLRADAPLRGERLCFAGYQPRGCRHLEPRELPA